MPFTDKSEGMWEISVEYPQFTSGVAVAAHANGEILAVAKQDFGEFLAMAQAEVPEMREYGSAGIYFLQALPTVTIDTQNLCSAYVESDTSTGGANTSRTFNVFNYAQDGGSVRQLKLVDLFYYADREVLGYVSEAVENEIMAFDNQPSSIASGSWPGMSEEQAERFVIRQNGLLFLFNKGEIGSSAEGTFKVLVPFENLLGLDYEGYLKPLFDDQYRHSHQVLRTGRWVLSEIRYNNDTMLKSAQNEDGSLVQENWVEFREDGLNGQAGVNSFKGDYQASQDGHLKIGTLAMTKALNPPDSIADHFERNTPDVYSFMLEDGVLYLELPMDVGTMVLMNAGVDGVW